MSKTRHTGIELLRVFLMFLIILGHLFTHSHLRQELPLLSAKGAWCWGWQALGLCAVNCFVLITGYFMYRNEWKISRLIKLWLTIWIYAIGIGGIFLLTGKASLSVPVLLDMLFPVLRQVWWFMSVYVLLYLFIPFLNIGLHQLKSRQFTFLVTLLVVIFYVLPLLGFFFPPYDPTQGMGIIGFITLYVMGAYLAANDFCLPRKWCLTALLFNNICIFLSKGVLEYISDSYQLQVGTGLLYHYNSIFELLNAILLLLLFKQMSFSAGKRVITWTASSMFSVYLLHEHPLVRQLLWQSGLSSFLLQSSFMNFALLTLLFSLVILVLGVLIDKAMGLVLLNPIFHSKFLKKITSYFQQIDTLFSSSEDIC